MRMVVVDIYGCGWVVWDPIEGWGPEKRQGGTRMIIVDTDYTTQS